MRGTKAKKIRKKIYGDAGQATVDRRKYGQSRTSRQVINLGLRAQYQLAKKEVKHADK